ncbi:MAG: hypothetical protein KatS3mg003_0284 [Candidatus Nitrosocaldaceae archaeon]|nr:MAG: hypothetical protein KatS3mg003_0284 [Candidatus Nitrosocaldaceae archaeon]
MNNVNSNKLRDGIRSVLLNIPSKALEGHKELVNQIEELIEDNKDLSSIIEESDCDKKAFSISIEKLFKKVSSCINDREYEGSQSYFKSLEKKFKSLNDSEEEIIDSFIDDYMNEILDGKATFCKISILDGIDIYKPLAEDINFDIKLTGEKTEILLRALPLWFNDITKLSLKDIKGIYDGSIHNSYHATQLRLWERLEWNYKLVLITKEEIDLSSFNTEYSIICKKDITGASIRPYAKLFDVTKLYTNEAKLLAILRLFKIGDVKVIRSHLFKIVKGSDKDILVPLISTNDYDKEPMHKYTLRNEDDVRLLQEFWKQLSNSEPFKPYETSFEKYYLELAYEDYTDAMLQKNYIKSLVYSIMGIDSLFGLDEQGIRENIKNRISKLFNILNSLYSYKYSNYGYMVYSAYGVRNKYVHGDIKYIEKLEEFKQNYKLEDLLECLRISLIIIILIDMNDLSKIPSQKQDFKKRFVDIMDNASEADLKNMLDEKLKDIKECLKPSTQ